MTTIFLTCWVALLAPDWVRGDDANVFCDKSLPNYCENHVQCRSEKTRLCGFPTKLSDRVQKVILSIHNKCRNSVPSKGTHRSKRPGEKIPELKALPSSADMALMSWDVELSQVAHHWVASCAVENQAQNMSKGNTTEDNNAKPEADSNEEFCFNVPRFKVDGWLQIMPGTIYTPLFNVWKDHLWELCSNVSTTLTEHIIESYRPPSGEDKFTEAGACLLWAHASRLGCAHRRESGMAPERSFIALACLYGPAPLRPGLPVYRRGPPASMCAEPNAASDSHMYQLCTIGRTDDEKLPVVIVICCAILLSFIVFCSVGTM